MITLRSLDPSSALDAQLQQGTGPVVLVSVFVVPPTATGEFLALWRDDVAFISTRPGFVGTRLHRGTAGSRLLWAVAEWESTQALTAAIAAAGADPERSRGVRALASEVTAYIHIFHKNPVAEVPRRDSGMSAGSGGGRVGADMSSSRSRRGRGE